MLLYAEYMFFIRHGQSAFNVEFNRSGRDPGIRDAGLTPRGVEQARGAAHQLKNKGITRIIASPYTRALQTAAHLNETLQLPITAEPLVGERALYTCDIGTPHSDLKRQWPDVDFTCVESEEWWPKTGETESGIEGRVRAFLSTMNDEKAAQTLVVSHWYFIFTLTGLDAENAEIIHRDTRGRFHKQSY